MKTGIIQRYKVEDSEFNTAKEAFRFVENVLGSHIDKMGNLSPRDRINVYEYLVKNREVIADILMTLSDILKLDEREV